jgi:ABC-type enterochelin transport system permease subunit
MPSFFTAVSISISAFSLFNLICDNINITTPPIYFLSLYVYIISLKVLKVKLNYTTKSGVIQSLIVIIVVNLNFSMIFLKFLLKLSQEVL